MGPPPLAVDLVWPQQVALNPPLTYRLLFPSHSHLSLVPNPPQTVEPLPPPSLTDFPSSSSTGMHSPGCFEDTVRRCESHLTRRKSSFSRPTTHSGPLSNRTSSSYCRPWVSSTTRGQGWSPSRLHRGPHRLTPSPSPYTRRGRFFPTPLPARLAAALAQMKQLLDPTCARPGTSPTPTPVLPAHPSREKER